MSHPDCTMSNPNKWVILVATFVGMIVTQVPIETFFKEFFLAPERGILNTKKFPAGTKTRADKAKMMGERSYRLVIYLGCTVALFLILSQEGCGYLDRRMPFGTVERPLYYHNYPCQAIPDHLDNFYIFKISHHLYQLIHTLLLDR